MKWFEEHKELMVGSDDEAPGSSYRAIAQIDAINQMLRQGVEEKVDHQMSLRNLLGIVNAYGAS